MMRKPLVYTLLFSFLSTLPIAYLRAAQSLANITSANPCPLRYKLTTEDEFLRLAGNPKKVTEIKDGGIHLKILEYKEGKARFTRTSESKQPYTLYSLFLYANDGPVDIGQNGPIVLTELKQLALFSGFTGLEGVDLSKLDLRAEGTFLFDSPFDSNTKWPEETRLPKDFDPKLILENGKNPGLGIKKLHRAGITGKGVRIAIMDQPPLLNHEDYVHTFEYYDNTRAPQADPQMHGAALASIAVGKSCGVAPEASLHYYSVPMWKADNSFYIDCLEAIVERNTSLPEEQRVRAVACSTAMFSRYPRYDEYQKVFEKAWKSGIVVFTCESIADPKFRYCMLNYKPGADPDDTSIYEPVSWIHPSFRERVTLWLPGGTRTVASPKDITEYDFDTDCGNSWGTPFLAGLTALALQANPRLTPDQIIELLHASARKMKFGPIVNPVAFIAAAKAKKK